MLYNKYRPANFDEVVGQKDTIENIRIQSQKDKFFGVYILCGQYGSGKTTTARIIAMAANCQHKDANGNPCGKCPDCQSIISGTAADVQEVAAAVNTGVDTVREICETASYLPVVFRRKVYIIDEVQALSKAAFQAFLKMLEEPPKDVIFILATTDVGAIPPTVRSRSAVYYFKQLTQEEIAGHCRKVSDAEGLSVTDNACEVIAKYSQGSMRNALSLLDMATQEGPCDGEKVEKLLGASTPDSVFAVIKAVLAGNAGEVIQKVTELVNGGNDLSLFIGDVMNAVSDLAVASVSLESVKGTEHYLSLIRETVVLGSAVRFINIADELYKAKSIMGKTPDMAMLIVSFVRLAKRSDVVSLVETSNDETAMLKRAVAALEAELRELKRSGISVVTEKAEEKAEPAVVCEEQKEPVEAAPAVEITPVVENPVVEATAEAPAVIEEVPVSEEDGECQSCVHVSECDSMGYREGCVSSGYSGYEPQMDLIEPEYLNLDTDLPEESVREEGIKEVPVDEVEETKVETKVEVKADSADMGYDDFDELIALVTGETLAVSKPGNADEAWKNFHALENYPDFKAAMSCCEVEERGDKVVIKTIFPVVKRFVGVYLSVKDSDGIVVE